MTIHIGILGILLAALLYLPAWGQTPRRNEPAFDARQVDQCMANWAGMPVRIEFGALQVRDILVRRDDSGGPPRRGAVLTDLMRVSYGHLAPGAVTDPVTLEGEQHILYVAGGTGAITMGRQVGDLTEGVGVIVPPGLAFSIASTGAEPLTMYIIVEPVPAGFSPPRHLVVHNAYDNEISTNNARTGSDQWLLSLYDGLSTAVGVNPVIFEPESLYPPHTHPPGAEEVWICLSGGMECYIGNERRALGAGTAYRPPSDNQTPHVNLNATQTTKRMLWIMVIPREEAAGESGGIM